VKVRETNPQISSMNYLWNPSARAPAAPAQGPSAAVYYPQYAHLHSNTNNPPPVSYTPAMPAPIPLPSDPRVAGFVTSPFPVSQPTILPKSHGHAGATLPSIYQIPSGSVPSHSFFNRTPSMLDSLQMPLLALPPTPILNNSHELPESALPVTAK